MFYAVANGRAVGVFTNWTDCKHSVQGFSGAVFKKFDTKIDAEVFIASNSLDENVGEAKQTAVFGSNFVGESRMSLDTQTPPVDSLLDKYIKSLSDKEYQGYMIAKSHLGSSFDLEKSTGFREWKQNNAPK